MRCIALLAALLAVGAIVDRVSIVVGKHPILSSAIDRDIRVTTFLNRDRPDFSTASRRNAASRLIDQELIRDQVRDGGYPVAPKNEADELIDQLKKERFTSESQYRRALSQAGLTEDELKDRLLWQMTVLRFIDARFRPAVVISDQEIQRYYTAHHDQFKGSLDDSRPQITDALSADRVNGLLDDWLKEQRRQTRIEYLEKNLQ
jgi:parvulin-like peptidyl-prolyl isomerase